MNTQLDEPAARRRIAELQLATPQGVRSAAHLLVAWGLYAAGVVLTLQVHSLAVRLPVWFLMGWLLLGNGALVHETLHGHTFSAKWANRLVGTVCGLSVGLPFAAYRAYHLGHHQHSCTADDPEGAPYQFTTRFQFLLLPIGGPLFALQFVRWTLASAFGHAPVWVRSPRQRRALVLDGVVSIAFYAAMVWLGISHLDVLLCVWLVPWLFTMVLFEPFVLVPEHYGAKAEFADSALLTTRTVWSNPLLTWVYWGNNFHTAHHLHGGAVHQNVRAITRDFVAPNIGGDWIESGYLAFHWRIFRGLPWLPARR